MNFAKTCGYAFMDAYIPIVEKRKNTTFTEDQNMAINLPTTEENYGGGEQNQALPKGLYQAKLAYYYFSKGNLHGNDLPVPRSHLPLARLSW